MIAELRRRGLKVKVFQGADKMAKVDRKRQEYRLAGARWILDIADSVKTGGKRDGRIKSMSILWL